MTTSRKVIGSWPPDLVALKKKIPQWWALFPAIRNRNIAWAPTDNLASGNWTQLKNRSMPAAMTVSGPCIVDWNNLFSKPVRHLNSELSWKWNFLEFISYEGHMSWPLQESRNPESRSSARWSHQRCYLRNFKFRGPKFHPFVFKFIVKKI